MRIDPREWGLYLAVFAEREIPAVAARGVGAGEKLTKRTEVGLVSPVPYFLQHVQRARSHDADQRLAGIFDRRQHNHRRLAELSRFRVGAAVATHDGRVFHGCNVENASYGLTTCAERTALLAAIAAGVKPSEFAQLAVIADTAQPIAPCGACRQVMIELGGPQLPIRLANLQGLQFRGVHQVRGAQSPLMT